MMSNAWKSERRLAAQKMNQPEGSRLLKKTKKRETRRRRRRAGISKTVFSKYEKLTAILKDMKNVLVAFSGGVDSTLLLRAASDALGEKVLAVIAASETYPAKETEAARRLAQSLKVRQRVILTRELEKSDFSSNPPQRCYHCKKELFGIMRAIARKEGIKHVLDGSNIDDGKDFRPGARAAEEFGIRSPLREAGLIKAEIRRLSRYLDLPTWDKPSLACLASRFPYGTPIQAKSLRQIGAAEDYLRELGFRQVRVRHHGLIARIEIDPREFPRVLGRGLAGRIVRRLKELGYAYVTMDLAGYRTGSLNEILNKCAAKKALSPRK